ncbi:hypothetical protein [Microvirga tunisiensis]|uniref:Uncharacterized protein n=1 Tax=Microvirga tunisiensis TaxID=2108360 RepID=A0A5N7MM32_9HYPH|nr:hypothetical protein [Microvirga tunisiensis]MPR09290.1 hypothetical protein [Microvirga tunisiensis]MPR27499.1 hypothetical protein [Microvirga tunisiensis]
MAATAGNSWAEGPTTEQLTADIQAIDQEIAAAQERADHFKEGSFIRVQIDLEMATLRTTRAMLDQKLKSWLRGIDLKYTVEGKSLSPASDEVIKKAEEDVEAAEAELQAAEAKTGTYSGLLGSMTLLEAQTHRVTVATARMRLAILRLGLSIPASFGPGGAPKPAEAPIGKTIDEKGAL